VSSYDTRHEGGEQPGVLDDFGFEAGGCFLGFEGVGRRVEEAGEAVKVGGGDAVGGGFAGVHAVFESEDDVRGGGGRGEEAARAVGIVEEVDLRFWRGGQLGVYRRGMLGGGLR